MATSAGKSSGKGAGPTSGAAGAGSFHAINSLCDQEDYKGQLKALKKQPPTHGSRRGGDPDLKYSRHETQNRIHVSLL